MEVGRTLFNHKPALRKEVQYFIDCFENTLFKEKIIFEELEKSSKNLGEQVVPTCISLLDENLESITLKVLTCCKLSQKILALDQSELKEDVSEDSSELDDFLQNITDQKNDIDSTFKESIANLYEEYDEMEKQLTRKSSSL